MPSFLEFLALSLPVTTIAAVPSEVPDTSLLAARETRINAATDLVLSVYSSTNCDQGKEVKQWLPAGAIMAADNYDNQNPSISGPGFFSSFALSRDLQVGEVLDFSMEGGPAAYDPIECGLFAQTVMALLSAGQFYTLNGPVTCFRL